MNRQKSSRPRSRRNRQSPLSFQSLERREVMAGNVTVFMNGGGLVLNGDADDNAIRIVVAGESQFAVEPGDETTTINGSSSPFLISGLTGNLRIMGRAGNDSVFSETAPVRRGEVGLLT